MRHNETKTDKPYRKDGFASIGGSSNKVPTNPGTSVPYLHTFSQSKATSQT